MKLKMLTGLSGPDYSLAPGDEREFEDAEAGRLIEAGFAIAVESAPRKTAAAKAPTKEG
jgi:hypothetical protein